MHILDIIIRFQMTLAYRDFVQYLKNVVEGVLITHGKKGI